MGRCRSYVEAILFALTFVIALAPVLLVSIFYFLLWLVPKKAKSLKDEVVVITGAGGGLGRELALRLAARNAKVVLWDIKEAQLTNVANEITSKGGYARAYVCNVTNEIDVIACARKVEAEVGDVTLLLNNAGVLQNVPFDELDSGRIRQTLEVNLLAHFWTIRVFLPKMLARNRGHIVAISSISGLLGTKNYSDYGASKFGIVGLMQALADEIRLKKKRICCTTICPVAIETGLIQNTASRNSWMMPVLTVEEAADQIITAIKKEKKLVTLPGRILFILGCAKLLPNRITEIGLDFAEYCRVPNIVEKSPV